MATIEEYEVLIKSISGECEKLHKMINDIRTEIERKKFGMKDYEFGRRFESDIHAAFDAGLTCALQIIDAHMKGEAK